MAIWENLIKEYRKTKKVSDSLKITTLAQCIVASDRGVSDLASQHFNFASLKFRERMDGVAKPVDHTDADGLLDTYCKFKSAADFIEGYWTFIDQGPYAGWKDHKADGAAYLRHITARGYSEDPDYVFEVISAFSEARDALFGTAVKEEGLGNAAARRKVAVIVGHNAKKMGASAPFPLATSEFPYNQKIAAIMKQFAGEYEIEVKVFERIYVGSHKKEIDRAYAKVGEWDPECAMELHFNDFESSAAHGTEVLYRSDMKSVRVFAQKVQDELLSTLGFRDRKVKPTKKNANGGRSLHALNNVPTVLVEPFFGSNKKENAKMAAEGEEVLARAYLRGIRDFLG